MNYVKTLITVMVSYEKMIIFKGMPTYRTEVTRSASLIFSREVLFDDALEVKLIVYSPAHRW